MKPIPFFLASRSPRRKELLEQAGLRFRVYVPEEEELPAPKKTRKETPRAIVKRISLAKAHAAHRELTAKGENEGLILSADTLVFLNGKVLGKPANKQDAKKMLRMLSGRWHQVCTAVTCVKFKGTQAKIKSVCITSRVKFFSLSKESIDWYAGTGEPLDKAGAYGAQAFGAFLIERFSGSYTNVVGLPVGESLSLLEKVSGMSRNRLMEKP